MFAVQSLQYSCALAGGISGMHSTSTAVCHTLTTAVPEISGLQGCDAVCLKVKALGFVEMSETST